MRILRFLHRLPIPDWLIALLILASLVIALRAIGATGETFLAPSLVIAPISLSATQLGQCAIAYVAMRIGLLPHVAIGEDLDIDGRHGVVSDKGVLFTKLRDGSGRSITVPNAKFFQDSYATIVHKEIICSTPSS